MKILILGATGMLGHKVYQVLRDTHEVWAGVRRRSEDLEQLGLFDVNRFIGGLRVEDDRQLEAALETSGAAVAINCVGVVKQVAVAKDPIAEISINALLPHRLQRLCDSRGIRLIHFSTDCVYSGRKGGYTEDEPADSQDLYGRSKHLGEVAGVRALTLRTSIIGRELATSHGLVEWFLSQPGPEVSGFSRAVFSGLPTVVLAEALRDIVLPREDLAGVWHISADPVSKHDLLVLLGEAFERNVTIVPVEEPVIDRSLDSSRLRAATAFLPLSWPELVTRLTSDPTPYERWRSGRVACATSEPMIARLAGF